MEIVGDFLNSPACANAFRANAGFDGELLFLSAWADGGAAFPVQRGGLQKSLFAVMVQDQVFRSGSV